MDHDRALERSADTTPVRKLDKRNDRLSNSHLCNRCIQISENVLKLDYEYMEDSFGDIPKELETAECSMCRFLFECGRELRDLFPSQIISSQAAEALKVAGSGGYNLIGYVIQSLARPPGERIEKVQLTIRRMVYPSHLQHKVRKRWIMRHENQSGSGVIRAGARLPARTADFHAVKQWLSYCDSHHYECGLMETPIPGLRVIDCNTRDIVDHPPQQPYAALSYLWGSNASSSADAEETVHGDKSV